MRTPASLIVVLLLPACADFNAGFAKGWNRRRDLDRAKAVERSRSGRGADHAPAYSQSGTGGGYPSATWSTEAIESQIDGDFEGWEGETLVKLMNGQIWEQTEYYYQYHYAFMPKVIVYNSNGRWMMKVDGISKAVGVQRIK